MNNMTLIERIAKAIYLLQPETYERTRYEGTAKLTEIVGIEPFETACNRDNAIEKAQAALAVVLEELVSSPIQQECADAISVWETGTKCQDGWLHKSRDFESYSEIVLKTAADRLKAGHEN